MARRTKRSLFVGVAGLVALLVVAVLVGPLGAGSETDTDREGPAVTLPRAHEVLLLRAGLGPAAFAAAGVSSQTLSVQLAEAEQDLGTALGALGAADEAYAPARVQRDALKRLVQSGQGSEQDVLALAEAQTALLLAEADRQGALDAAFAAATSSLSGAQTASLSRIRASADRKWCPIQYRVLEQDEAAWLALRGALAGARTHQDLGEAPPQECLAHLAQCDGDPAVSTALTQHDAHLATVQALWDATFVE